MSTRKTADDIYADKPFLSIIGGLQYKPFREIFSNDEIGMKERFIFGFSNVNLTVRNMNNIDISDKTYLDYFEGLKHVRSQSESLVKGKKHHEYVLSEDAEKIWRKWASMDYNVAGKPDAMIDKSIARCIRFALILEIFKNPTRKNQTISYNSMSGAIKLSIFFMNNHLNAIELFNEGKHDRQIEKALNWIRNCYNDKKHFEYAGNGYGISISKFANYNVADVKTIAEAKVILGFLEDQKYGKIFNETKKGRIKSVFVLRLNK